MRRTGETPAVGVEGLGGEEDVGGHGDEEVGHADCCLWRRLVGCGKAGKGKGREGETHSGRDGPLFILDCCMVIDTWKPRECTHS